MSGTTTDDTPTRRLLDSDLVRLLELVQGADSVELKLTVPESSRRATVRVLGIDPLDAQIRQVFFLDTPDLALNRAGLVIRARRVQGRGDDTVVKLRPVVPDEVPDKFRRPNDMVVEVDVMPTGFVCSASVKGRVTSPNVKEVMAGAAPLRKLFSKTQRTFFSDHAPDGIELDGLSVLGPIFVLKVNFVPDGLAQKLVAELWLYPDGSRVAELSTKCAPADAIKTALALRDYFQVRGVEISADQQTKTKTAVAFFARELRSAPPGSTQ
jgi:hypothetical protein